MEPWAVILLVVAGLVALWLIVLLIIVLGMAAIAGAVVLLAFAGEQGFVGLAAYIALWVFLFPVMLVVSIIIGLFIMWSDHRTERTLDERRRLRYDD